MHLSTRRAHPLSLRDIYFIRRPYHTPRAKFEWNRHPRPRIPNGPRRGTTPHKRKSQCNDPPPPMETPAIANVVFGKKVIFNILNSNDSKTWPELIYIDQNYIPKCNHDPLLQSTLDLIQKRNIKSIPISRKKIGIISGNPKLDDGIVAQISNDSNAFGGDQIGQFLSSGVRSRYRMIALERVTDPNTMGLLMRSLFAAGTLDAILLSPGCVHELDPLVLKASCGTSLIVAKSQANPSPPLVIIHTPHILPESIQKFKNDGADIALLTSQNSGHLSHPLWNYHPPQKTVFIIEGDHLDHDPILSKLSTTKLHIPMTNNVETLNCAISSSLIAFSLSSAKS